jgi:hypothetical protein
MMESRSVLIFETFWIRILPGQLDNWQNLSVHVGLMQDLNSNLKIFYVIKHEMN